MTGQRHVHRLETRIKVSGYADSVNSRFVQMSAKKDQFFQSINQSIQIDLLLINQSIDPDRSFTNQSIDRSIDWIECEFVPVVIAIILATASCAFIFYSNPVCSSLISSLTAFLPGGGLRGSRARSSLQKTGWVTVFTVTPLIEINLATVRRIRSCLKYKKKF